MLRRIAPVIVALLLFAAGAASLRQYGVTWDEALGDLFFGQRYASFFTSFDTRYLDFGAEPYPPGHRPDLRRSPFRIYPWEYYPVANTLAALTSSAAMRLGVDPFDGFHLFNLLAGAVFVIFFWRVLERHTSTRTAAAATFVLFLMPRLVNEALCNIKDFPEMLFFSAAALAAYDGIVRSGRGSLLASGVLWGLALGTKPNAIFLPLIVIPFALIENRRALRSLCVAGAIGAAVFYASWPWIWPDPLRRLHWNAFYLATRSSITPQASTTSPFAMLLWTTPPIVIVMALAGLAIVIRRARDEQEPLARFVLLWIGVVAFRLVLPNAINFDGVRHFLEIFPPIAIACGMALEAVARRRRRIADAAVAAVPAVLIAAVVQCHPYEIAYWNAIAGGIRGAAARHIPQYGDYWAVSYRDATNWLNAHAKPKAVVIVPIGEQSIRVPSAERLRADLRVPGVMPHKPTRDPRRLAAVLALSRRLPVYVVFVLRDEWRNEITDYCTAALRPAHEVSLDGIPLMRVYELAPK